MKNLGDVIKMLTSNYGIAIVKNDLHVYLYNKHNTILWLDKYFMFQDVFLPLTNKNSCKEVVTNYFDTLH